MQACRRTATAVFRAAVAPDITKLRDYPRVLLLWLGLSFAAAPVASFVAGSRSLVQLWAEVACVALGGLLLRVWWEIVR